MAEILTKPATAHAIITPHQVTLEGQRFDELIVGETVRQFLERCAQENTPENWEVRVNGALVPDYAMDRVRPKETALIEVRGIARKQVLAIVAMAALVYFTGGLAAGAYGSVLGVSSAAGLSVLGAVTFAGGPALGGRTIR